MTTASLGRHRRLAVVRRFSLTLAVLAMACSGDPTSASKSDNPEGLSFSVLSPTKTFPGDRVRVVQASANIRATASLSGVLVGIQPLGATGTVVAGPVVDAKGDKLTRWQINFDSGPDGWAADAYLDQTSAGSSIGSVTLSPTAPSVAVGQTVQLAAVVTDSTGAPIAAPAITWSTSSATIATVTSAGLVKGVASGKTTITASSRGKSASVSVTAAKYVIGSRVQTNGTANIRATAHISGTLVGVQAANVAGVVIGGPVLDSAGDKLIRWQVDFDTGPDGWAADQYLTTSATAAPVPVASVLLTPDTTHVTAGKTVQLTAVAKDAGGNAMSGVAIGFASLDTLVGRVNSAGLVTGVAAGAARIVASASSHADTSVITVLATPVGSVAVTPATASIVAGATVQLAATAKDSSGAVLAGRLMTWSSSDTAIATVSVAGLVTSRAAGAATIAAASGGKTGTANITVTASVRAGWFVTPSGTAAGNGSMLKPWNLATALAGASGKVQPGDTIWLRGGRYTGSFRSMVSGTAAAPVVVRQYPGERAIIDGAGTPGGAQSVWYVGGQYSEFWDFEITNSDAGRTTSSTANNVRPNVVANYASHTKYINLVVHDGGVAFYTEPVYPDVEITGCIVYNNGWQGPDRGHGHGLYLKNNTGPVTVRDNIIFDQFGFGIHGYSDAGSGHINNIWFDGNVSFNNGTLANNSTSANILLGGADIATGDVLSNNYTYFSPGVGGINVEIGYSTTQNGTVQVSGGYFVGGAPVMQVGNWTSATMSNNTLIGGGKMVSVLDNAVAPWSWGGHRYYANGAASDWGFLSNSYTLQGWQNATGLGASDATMSGTPATQVVVRKNPDETGRANVIVYNWSQQGSAMVDLTGIVPAGAKFQVHNVQDLWGTPVASGVGPTVVNLSLAAVMPATAVGMPANAAPSTGTAFQVFVVNIVP